MQPQQQRTVRKAPAAEVAKEAVHTAGWSNPKGCLWNVCAAGRQHIARTDHTSCICTSNEAALVWEHGKGLSWTACVLLPKHVYFTLYTWLLARLKVPQVPQSLSFCLWSRTVWIMFPLAIYLCNKAGTSLHWPLNNPPQAFVEALVLSVYALTHNLTIFHDLAYPLSFSLMFLMWWGWYNLCLY